MSEIDRQAQAIVSHHELIWEIMKRTPSTRNKVLKLNETLEALIHHALGKEEEEGRAYLSYVISHINIYLLLKIRLPLWDTLFQSTHTKPESERYLLQRLNPVARAKLIQAIQQTDDVNNDFRKLNIVTTLVMTVNPDELMALKNLIDGGGDRHNLYKLIYQDVPKYDRERLLRFFLNKVNSGLIDFRSHITNRRRLKILSDVDDTLICSGGRPGGVDDEYPKHEAYPGVLALFRVLDVGSSTFRGLLVQDRASVMGDAMRITLNNSDRENVFRHGVGKFLRKRTDGHSFERQQLELEFGPSEQREAHLCNVTFLSLRPHFYAGWAEAKSYGAFARLVAAGRMHCMPTLLPGNLMSATEAIFAHLDIKWSLVFGLILSGILIWIGNMYRVHIPMEKVSSGGLETLTLTLTLIERS